MALLQELDTGTPIRTGEATVTLTIDGRKVSVPPGTSVMAAAALIDNPIPKLCATDSLEAFGSCRLCLVEIEGRKGTPASCTTPAEAGMVVHTQTPRLQRLRRGRDGALHLRPSARLPDLQRQRRLRVADPGRRSSACATCATATTAPIISTRRPTPPIPISPSNPSKCIVCSRCVRACEEVQGTFALTILGRGFDSKVGTGGVDFLSSECVSCGACVQACPTATLNEKSVIEKGTPERTVVDDLRLLRRRLLVQGGAQGRRGRAHGPLQGRQGQRGPFLRQGPVRLRLRHAQGPHPQADDPRADRGPVARSLLGRGDRLRGERIQAHPGEVRARLGRRDHAPRAAPTRKCSSFRRWCAPASATTTSTPARASATRRPATGSRRPSAPRPARRISSRSTSRTSWS